MVVRAKICGVRSDCDLEVAVAAGADAVGFICGVTHVTEDALEPTEAARLVRATPPFVSTVLVTHLREGGAILALADFLGVDTIQVHGLNAEAACEEVWRHRGNRRVIKALHVTDRTVITRALDQASYCDAILLDSCTTERLGGTGRTHDWGISSEVAALLRSKGKPVIVAGGLTPDNVVEAIGTTAPYGVDVNSGVEDSAGSKSPERCRAFVSSAHSTA